MAQDIRIYTPIQAPPANQNQPQAPTVQPLAIRGLISVRNVLLSLCFIATIIFDTISLNIILGIYLLNNSIYWMVLSFISIIVVIRIIDKQYSTKPMLIACATSIIALALFLLASIFWPTIKVEEKVKTSNGKTESRIIEKEFSVSAIANRAQEKKDVYNSVPTPQVSKGFIIKNGELHVDLGIEEEVTRNFSLPVKGDKTPYINIPADYRWRGEYVKTVLLEIDVRRVLRHPNTPMEFGPGSHRIRITAVTDNTDYLLAVRKQ